MEVRSDRRYLLPAPPEDVWRAASSVGRYQDWWPWLRHLDADGFDEGAVWRCTVRPPLPYAVRMTIRLQEVRAPSWVRAVVTGDVRGDAELSITAADGGTEARLVSRLAPSNGALVAFARIARPLVRYGHDWVLDRGARQFEAGALDGRPAPDADPDPDDPVAAG